MNRLVLAFILGLVVGAALRRRSADVTLQDRYNAVKAAEAGGKIDTGIAWGDLEDADDER